MTRLAAAPALALALLLSACLPGPGGSPDPAPSGERLTIVTTTTVLADMVRQVTGDRAQVHALVPRGADVHTFDPAPSDAATVSRAALLVLNGLGLDDWLADFAQAAGATGTPLLELAEDLPGVDYLAGGEHADDEAPDGEHAYNPHLWLNVAHARLYVARLADALAAVDIGGAATYRSNAAAYDVRLADLDGWIRGQLESLPAAQRRVVSFHDAFPYFAAAYGVEIVGVLVEVPGHDPSPAELARLIGAIRASGVKVILAESQFSDRLAQTVAAETDARVINQLYTDSLGGPPADTFEGAMRGNVEQIVEGLR